MCTFSPHEYVVVAHDLVQVGIGCGGCHMEIDQIINAKSHNLAVTGEYME